MKRWQKVLGTVVIIIGLLAGIVVYKNQPPQLAKPNYYEYYKTQDTKPDGKVGILIIHLVLPEDMHEEEYYNITFKALQYIPWPIREIVTADKGTLLLDAQKPYEFEEFVPTDLRDSKGGDTASDGETYMQKYEQGELTWVPPSETRHLDHGYFLYEAQKGDMPTMTSKVITKARLYYYGIGVSNHKSPHEAGSRIIAEETMKLVTEQYGDIPWRWTSSELFDQTHQYVNELLDSGVDTLIIASPAPIFSHHEEFNGSYRHAMHYVHEWEKENGKEIKVIFSQQLGDFDILRDAYLNMLRDRLDTLPADASVQVVVSVHGMPWDAVPHEAWLELAPKYRDGMVRDAKTMLEEYPFPKQSVIQSQDHFADPYNNPNGTYLSTNTAFWDAIHEDYDYVINLPIEFFAENTDTMFAHAMYNFEGFPNFNRYETIEYNDWSVPYTREFIVEGTHIIYNGLPVGDYNKPILMAFYESLAVILDQK